MNHRKGSDNSDWFYQQCSIPTQLTTVGVPSWYGRELEKLAKPINEEALEMNSNPQIHNPANFDDGRNTIPQGYNILPPGGFQPLYNPNLTAQEWMSNKIEDYQRRIKELETMSLMVKNAGMLNSPVQDVARLFNLHYVGY